MLLPQESQSHSEVRRPPVAKMGVLSRRRSLLVKLIVVVTTAWFTIAFLLYTDNQGRQQQQQEVALPVVRQDDRINEVEAPEKVVPFKEDVEKREANVAVLAPPQNQHGEMGKPVVLPANLSGKFV